MPFIVLKRDDIPASTLQVLDLKPNTSQRNLIYDPPGQTKYVNPVLNDMAVTTGTLGATVVQTFTETRGLAAWFASAINDGTGAAAAGTLTIAAGNVADTETVTLDASAVGGPAVVFTFVAGAPALPTEVMVGGDNNASTANLLAAIQNPANGLDSFVLAAAGGALNEIDFTVATDGTAGNGVTNATSSANVTPAVFAGGMDAGPISAADANTIAADILANLVRFGDLANPAVAADLAAVNAEVQNTVATAALTSEQLSRVLEILSGRVFVLPAGVQIADATGAYNLSPALGSADGPRFDDPSTRFTYQSGALVTSYGEGELSGFVSSDFIYRNVSGANGEAVVVYNDDGTLFTVTP